MAKVTKEIALPASVIAAVEAEMNKANIVATILGEFYDTLKNTDMPEDLCKELTLTWMGKYEGFDGE